MILRLAGLGRFFSLSLALSTVLPAADPAIEALLPLAPEIRQIMDQRCVMCHGEVIDGQVEIREDLDLSTDDKMRETLISVKALVDVIAEGKMPHEAKLSFRLRRNPQMQDRLKTIKEQFDAEGEQQKLLAWLAAAGFTPQPKE
jgi:hypothetical protein